MKTIATALVVTALLAMHVHGGDATDVDSLASLMPDTMVLGSSRSSSRLIARSSANDDTAVMTTTTKLTSRGKDESESLLGGTAPTRGSSAVRSTTTMVATVNADHDAATMTTTRATRVHAEAP